MSINTYALHTFQDEQNLGFSAEEYSKFKHGDKGVARDFGHSLAKGLVEQTFFKNLIGLKKQIVVCSSPYQFIPTATFALKDYFIQILNEHLISKGGSPVQEQKIYRRAGYTEDYGSLNADQRRKLMTKDTFYIDKRFVEGKVILFLDDIRITGGHEERIRTMINEQELSNEMVLLYFASLTNQETNPNIENTLNYAFVKSLLDLDKIIKNNEFLINTRVVKYILNAPKEEFSTFINYQSDKFVKTLYHQAIGNGYSTIPQYSTNLNYTKDLLKGDL